MLDAHKDFQRKGIAAALSNGLEQAVIDDFLGRIKDRYGNRGCT